VKTLRLGMAVTGILVLGMAPAHAYLDPGSISTLLHSVLASLVALGIALKLYWHRLLRFFGLRKKASRTETADDRTAPPSSDSEASEDGASQPSAKR